MSDVTAPIIYRVTDASDASLIGLAVGEDELEKLLRETFEDAPADVTDAIGRVLDRAEGPAMQTYLDIEIDSPRADDLTDDEWGLLVWEACRDGDPWMEDDATTVQIRARAGEGSGLSRVAPALSGEHLVLVTRGGSTTERIVDGISEGWAGIRAAVQSQRHAAVLIEVRRAQKAVRDAEDHLAEAKRRFADSVREATEEGVSGPKLADALGITRARVYQLRDGRR